MLLLLVIVCQAWTVFHSLGAPLENSLRLYDSFAEIHQFYNGPIRFRQADWDNIKHESIVLRSVAESDSDRFFERRIVRLNTNMTGETPIYSSLSPPPLAFQAMPSSSDDIPSRSMPFSAISFSKKPITPLCAKSKVDITSRLVRISSSSRPNRNRVPSTKCHSILSSPIVP